MNNVHPVFAPILDSITATPDVLRLAAYRSALRRHDWAFEFADAGAVRRAGLRARVELEVERSRIDPTGDIWNEYAPADYKFDPRPIVSCEGCAAMDDMAGISL